MSKFFPWQILLATLLVSVSLSGCFYFGSVPAAPLVSTTVVECGPGTRPDANGVCR